MKETLIFCFAVFAAIAAQAEIKLGNATTNTVLAEPSDLASMTNQVRLAYDSATNAWTQITDHLSESWETVHSGSIKTAYDWATNSWARAGLAYDSATNAWARSGLAYDVGTNSWELAGSAYVQATSALAVAEGKASTNLNYIWQGAALVTSRFDVVLGGCATQNVDGSIQLLPYATNYYGATGTVEIISRDGYLVDVDYGWREPQAWESGVAFAYDEVEDGEVSLTESSVVVYAYCMGGGYSEYYAALSNLTAWTYDRPGMKPKSITNDAPGIVARVDKVTDFAGDRRLAMNMEATADYLDSRKVEIADQAWNRTPGGRDVPDRRFVTIDEPLVQQGTITLIPSGDFYCFTSAGGDWMTSTTGSLYRISVGGVPAFEINATNRMLHIQGFSVGSGYATIDISTNWIVGAPFVEFTGDLLSPQWLRAPEQTMANNTNYWRAVCPMGTNNARFFRAVSPGGENAIFSYFTHEFKSGVKLKDGATFSTIAELKTLLGI